MIDTGPGRLAYGASVAVSWWREQVVPRIANRLLDTADLYATRQRVCAGLAGEVVEIGFGSGLNLPHYPADVERVWAVDPSRVGYRLATDRLRTSSIPVEPGGLDGQSLPFADQRFDAALSTYTLCTIPDPVGALREVRRVLKPGGRLHFLEHGRAPDPGVARWQDRLEPVNRRLAGGCHITLDIPGLLAAAGLAVDRLRTYYGEGPRLVSYRYEGRALPGG